MNYEDNSLKSQISLCGVLMIIAELLRQHELQKVKFHVRTNTHERSSGIQFVSKSNGQDRTTARWCKFCGYKLPFSQPNKLMPCIWIKVHEV